MKLMDKIAEDMKTAMKSGQKLRLETLRTIRAGLLEKVVEKRPSGEMTTDDETTVLLSAAKKRKEAIEIYRQNNRNDLADQEEKELQIIQEYLPKQLTEEEIEVIIRKIIMDIGSPTATEFGKVMPVVMKELKGKADGKIVQALLKTILG